MYQPCQIIKGIPKDSYQYEHIIVNLVVVEVRPEKYHLINTNNYVSVKYWDEPLTAVDLEAWISNNVDISEISNLSIT
jgi:hypothetical protein